MRRIVLVLTFVAVLAWTGAAVAATLVPGEYAFTGRVSYILTPYDSLHPTTTGFNPDTLSPNNPAASVTSNSITCQGIFTFKRDRTGTFDSTGVLLVLPPLPPGQAPHANAFTWSFTFTYDVADDDTITIEADENSFQVTFVTGPPPGAGFIANKYPLSGMVSADHKTITLGSPTTFIQTLTFSFGLVLQGIPNSSYVLTRLR